MAKVWIDRGGRVAFKCPGCGEVHAVPVNTPNGWSWNGSMDKPTLNPSLLTSSTDTKGHMVEICHLFVMDGKIRFLQDSPHKLKGQTVEMPDVKGDDI